MKKFNLLFDPWIPVIRTNQNEPKHIAAYEIVKKDILSLDAPRADFNAALTQFLIGLLQTVCAPENPRAWRNLFNQPPSEDDLKNRFEDIKDAFYLDGDSYRFMQDKSIRENGNIANILKLIPSIVGENTIEKNQDFFVKSSQISKSSIPNLILGLYLYQNYCLSETGGRDGRHHGSLRGRNTVTVYISKESGNLWENLWLNIIQNNSFKKLINSELPASCFEWMNDQPNDKQKTDSDMTLNDIYWSMPRRVWINFSDLNDGICDFNNQITKIIGNIYIKENGIEYKTKYIKHPLIPYFKNDDGFHPIKIGHEGINYGDWFSILRSDTASQNLLEHAGRRNLDGVFKIFVCGYLSHSQQAKTLCWYQTKLPLFIMPCEEKDRKEIESEIIKYIRASTMIGSSKDGYLSAAIRMAWFGYDYYVEQDKKKNKKPDPFYNKAAKSLYNHPTEISKCFWDNTESKFYDLMERLYCDADRNMLTDEKKAEFRQEWYEHIKRETKSLFDRWAFVTGIQNNPQRIAKAYNKLMEKLNDKFLKQEILALP